MTNCTTTSTVSIISNYAFAGNIIYTAPGYIVVIIISDTITASFCASATGIHKRKFRHIKMINIGSLVIIPGRNIQRKQCIWKILFYTANHFMHIIGCFLHTYIVTVTVAVLIIVWFHQPDYWICFTEVFCCFFCIMFVTLLYRIK